MHIAFIYCSTYAHQGSHCIVLQSAPCRIYNANTRNVPYIFFSFFTTENNLVTGKKMLEVAHGQYSTVKAGSENEKWRGEYPDHQTGLVLGIGPPDNCLGPPVFDPIIRILNIKI